MDDARVARVRLEEQLEDLKIRKEELATRVRIVQTRKQVERSTDSERIGEDSSLLDQIAALEMTVDEDEAHLDVRRSLSAADQISLDERLRQIQHLAQVEERLAKLRKKP